MRFEDAKTFVHEEATRRYILQVGHLGQQHLSRIPPPPTGELLKSGKDLGAEKIQGSHDIVVGGVAGLNHDQELVNPQLFPLFHATADRVGVATDYEAVPKQFIVGSPKD